MLVAVITLAIIFSNNRDLRTQRDYLQQQYDEAEQQLQTLDGNLLRLQRQDAEWVDSLQRQNRMIARLKERKDRVRIVRISPEAVDTTNAEALAQEINQGRQCCAELAVADSLITELEGRGLIYDSLINNKDRQISNLTEQLALKDEQLALKNEQYQAALKEIRRHKRHKTLLIIAEIITLGVVGGAAVL